MSLSVCLSSCQDVLMTPSCLNKAILKREKTASSLWFYLFKSVCGKTPVIILTCKKSAKHFKTRKNLLLYEVILPFYSRQQYVQIRVTIYSDWICLFDHYSWYSSEGDASPPKQKSDWSQRVGFWGKMLWILISVVGSIYFLQLASLGQL